ncbi:HNH endonuclease [Bacillus phage Shbh1]|uniref:HNH homing endonuclease n=1 Tax=Bacillus phage Shbh1 TaxID=1796992 RepID=A0A142F1H8_9CAUD|nr:HNH endonuclease [Bacillus phage Shbh1]AMQ66635.1 HNH homing endonuclease [Bacillus phage Shbh1]
MEKWVKIKGHEEFYEVSDLGKVRNINTGRVLKPFRNYRGYYAVDLGFENRKRVPVHRLVIESFNPEGRFEGAEVDHVDGDKGNNRLSNLEWVTHEENLRRWAMKKGKPIIAISPEGTEYEFSNQQKFADEHNLIRKQINACLNGRQKSHKGWTFSCK